MAKQKENPTLHSSQVVLMTKGELDNLSSTIQQQTNEISAFKYIYNKFGLPENYKDILTSPEAVIPLKLSRKDTFEVVIDKLSKQIQKASKTRK